ncbi:hypothetical protein ACTV1L_000190 [Cronobacter turicensis]|nr:hypothetical protein [Cronobacter turicensis]
MTDIAKLKAAALAATPGEWPYQKTTPVTDAEIYAKNHTRVVNLLSGDVTPANSEFITLANPAAVLELIAQNEALVAAHMNLKLLADVYRQAYEEARARCAELEARTVTLPRPACTYADHSYPAYSERQVVELLESLGINLETGRE